MAVNKRNVWLGNGVFYFNFGEESEAVIGVTRDGGSFTVEKEIKPIEYDGTYGSVKGMNRKVSVVPKLSLNTIEINAENLSKFYAGMKSEAKTGYTEITESLDIADEDYLTNVAFVGQTATGKQVAIIIKNALSNGNLEMAFENKNEVAVNVEFEGCYDPSALTTIPYEMRIYDSGSYTVTFTVSDSEGVVEGATVVFNGTSKVTNSSGVAAFTNIAPETNKPYSIIMAGYNTINSSVTIDDNEAVNVTLSPIS